MPGSPVAEQQTRPARARSQGGTGHPALRPRAAAMVVCRGSGPARAHSGPAWICKDESRESDRSPQGRLVLLTVSNRFKGLCRSPSVSSEVVVNRRKRLCIKELRYPAAVEDARELICPGRQDHSEVELRGSKYWNQAMDSRAPSRHSREACPRPRSGSGNPSRSTNPEARSLKPSSRLLKSPAPGALRGGLAAPIERTSRLRALGRTTRG